MAQVHHINASSSSCVSYCMSHAISPTEFDQACFNTDSFKQLEHIKTWESGNIIIINKLILIDDSIYIEQPYQGVSAEGRSTIGKHD